MDIVAKSLYMSTAADAARELVQECLSSGEWWLLLPVTEEAKIKIDEVAKRYTPNSEELRSVKVIDTSMEFPGHYLLVISKSVLPLEDILAIFDEYNGMDMELVSSAQLLVGGVADAMQVYEQFKLWLYRA